MNKVSPAANTEDLLVQKTAADFFHDELKWESVYAYNEETFGPAGTLGRKSDKEVFLERYLREALVRNNPGLPQPAYDTAFRLITETRFERNDVRLNRDKYKLFREGVSVSFLNDKGVVEKKRLRVFDFDHPEKNHFLVVRELWIRHDPYRRRADLVGFINGIPLLFIELKNIHKDVKRAYEENLSDYKDTIPHVFDANAFIMLSNGFVAKMGSVTSKYNHFHEWRRLDEEDKGGVALEIMLRGVCTKTNFMDILENFILFDESSGKIIKIVTRNHQYLGVNRTFVNIQNRDKLNGQLGVFWHTQGSGKSYSMAFISQKVHRKLTGNFTFLIVTDREDLDTQIYKTYVGCGIVDNDQDQCRSASGKHLKTLLQADKRYVFTMVHKFNEDVREDQPYSDRSDIIVISDEAHRTQYGKLALNMRKALPKAHYLGFTGTPLFKDDEITRRIFGKYVSTYDFQQAVEDGSTVPLFYDNRGEKLNLTTTELNEKIAAKLEEIELDVDQEAALERELAREYHVITAERRLDDIAKDFVEHYTTRWESGKAMFVCIDKVTTLRMFNLVQKYWLERIAQFEKEAREEKDEQDIAQNLRRLEWTKETQMAVVISEEQGEMDKFRRWNLDIVPHRTLMKTGFDTPDGRRLEIDLAFKREEHPFRVAFVCAMWLTGFDVQSLSTLYLDKPLKAHTLMQAIARANRVNEGKENGLVVDYCGILKNLRKALATFAVGAPDGGSGVDPVKPEEEQLEDLAESIDAVKAYLSERAFDLARLHTKGFERLKELTAAKEVVNQSEETRKRFELLAREVFKKYKSCLTMKQVSRFSKDRDAIDLLYKGLQEDRQKADISQVLQELHKLVESVIAPDVREPNPDVDKVYDISRIDFDRLKEEFKHSPRKNTTVQSLKDVIEKKLKKLLDNNPLRTDFNRKYQEIIADYNLEKDRVTIEQTFAALLRFVQELDEEDRRALREGLDEENLALFDLLCKPELTSASREKLKRVAQDLLTSLKSEKLRIDHWREKEQSRSEIKSFIHDFLWDESKGLPIDAFTQQEVEEKTSLVFEHVLRQYEDWQHNKYAA